MTTWAEVTAVSGRRIAFKVRVADEAEETGVATHERVLIEMHRFGERLNAKANGSGHRTVL